MSNALDVQESLSKRRVFSLDEFVRANREKSNLIGWRQTLTTPIHIRFLLVRAKRIAQVGKDLYSTDAHLEINYSA